MFDEDFLGYGMYCHPLRLIEGQQAFGKANAQPGNRSLALSPFCGRSAPNLGLI
jgi:hypothetical protein